MKTYPLSVATPAETLYAGAVAALTLTTGAGEITVLPGHEPLVTTVRAGTLRITNAEGVRVEVSLIEDGILEILPEGVAILA